MSDAYDFDTYMEWSRVALIGELQLLDKERDKLRAEMTELQKCINYRDSLLWEFIGVGGHIMSSGLDTLIDRARQTLAETGGDDNDQD